MPNIPSLAAKFMLPSSHYDEQKANRVVEFVQCLKHTKAEWKNKTFELLPWQADIVRTLFGVIAENGTRQFKTCYITCAKKQGKTMFAAALALYLMVADFEEGAEIYSCAADRQQAALIYREAAIMAQNHPTLRGLVKVIESQKRLVYPKTNSFYQVLSSEAYSKHGINPHAVLFDETHVADREMFRVMTQGSSDARRNPIHLFISTAGNDIHSVGYELHKKAVGINDGRLTDSSFLPVIYQLEEGDDWTDEKNWSKANPSLNVTVSIDNLRRAVENAKQNPAEENITRQLRMNQWVKQSVRWMPMAAWNKCAFAIDEGELRGRECYAGLDLSSTTDITAFVLVFPPKNSDDKYIVLPFFWLPEDTLELRIRRDKVPYDKWVGQDKFFVTEGNVVNYEEIETFIKLAAEKYDLKEVAYDRWNATACVQHLTDEGVNMVPFGQGFGSMSSPTKELMKLVLEEKLAHGGNEPLSWMADNISIRQDPAGNVKPDKEKSTEKIDGIVALIMALDRAIRHEGGGGSIYDTRDLIVLG